MCGLVATLRACETPLLFGVGTLRRSGSLHVDTLADSLVLRSRYALGGLVVDVCLQNSPAHLSRYTHTVCGLVVARESLALLSLNTSV